MQMQISSIFEISNIERNDGTNIFRISIYTTINHSMPRRRGGCFPPVIVYHRRDPRFSRFLANFVNDIVDIVCRGFTGEARRGEATRPRTARIASRSVPPRGEACLTSVGG